MILFEFVKN